MPALHSKHLWATLVAVLLVAVTSAMVWTRDAQADHPAPHPDFSFLSGGLSDAALDRDLQGLDPAAQALAKGMDPVRQAHLAGRPVGWAVYDLGKVPSLNLRNAPTIGDARAINALIPSAVIANPPAQPFVLQASAADRAQALHCLTQAVYFEAAREPAAGQAAVAQTVLNRVRHPDYPKSVCGVVYQGASLKTGCQFSFTCDGSLNQPILPSVWKEAQGVAKRALGGYVMAAVGEATHYHADYVQPYWSPTLVKITQIGAHIFYRWTGPWGEPGAFTGRYAGHEAHLSPAILTEGDRRVARPDAIPPAHNVVDHVHTFTVADASSPGGVRTRVAGVFAVAPTLVAPARAPVRAAPAPTAPSAVQAASPAVAVTPPPKPVVAAPIVAAPIVQAPAAPAQAPTATS
ncbi:MAG TPA: cell wall hydrolase [Caulobacteraceae bacterium]|nr:cell wall hydrolase [Caulobacteraceae bacterium]